MATNKEQKITITSSSGLSDSDIERMVKDSEKFAEEDEKRFKDIEARNSADSMIYQVDKNLKEFEDKIEEADKNAINTAKEELQAALAGTDVAEIESKTEALATAMYAFTTKMYQNANPEESGEPGKDDVIDADFNISEEDEKK
jgi:molecular chaperone DnaK